MAIIGHTKKEVKAGESMISYAPLWETMKRQGVTTYSLRNSDPYYNISSSTIRRLRDGESISTNTIDNLCHILNCSVSDIIEYIDERP